MRRMAASEFLAWCVTARASAREAGNAATRKIECAAARLTHPTFPVFDAGYLPNPNKNVIAARAVQVANG